MQLHALLRHKLPTADVTRKLGVWTFRPWLLRSENTVDALQMNSQAVLLCELLAANVTREPGVRVFRSSWRPWRVNAMHILLVLCDVLFRAVFFAANIARVSRQVLSVCL